MSWDQYSACVWNSTVLSWKGETTSFFCFVSFAIECPCIGVLTQKRNQKINLRLQQHCPLLEGGNYGIFFVVRFNVAFGRKPKIEDMKMSWD